MESTFKHTKMLFCPAILAAASLLSCNDLSMNMPAAEGSAASGSMSAATQEPSFVMQPEPQEETGILTLEGMLSVPGGTTFASIGGQVTYSLGSMPYRGAFRISLDLSTDAILIPSDDGTTVWHAAGESHDQLMMIPGDTVLLHKRILLVGTNDRITLHMRFLLTRGRISLSSIWLEGRNVRV